MASVKVKFRPSTVNGREGTLYYQVIHNRVVRQINTEYKLFVSEWDCHSETVVLHILFLIMKNCLSFCFNSFFVELLLLDSTNQVGNCFWRFFTAHSQLYKEFLLSSIGVE